MVKDKQIDSGNGIKVSSSLEVFAKSIDDYYRKVNEENATARIKEESLYAIIGIKKKNSELARYGQPLYLDVKHFITEYLGSFETEDYGYDIPNNDKLIEAIESLPQKEQLSLCRFAKNLYEGRGYETRFLESKMDWLRMRIAWGECHIFSWLLRLSSLNVGTLLISYVFFLAVVYVILLPAPFEWMGVLDVVPHDFGTKQFMNGLLNALALATGGDYAPSVTPCGLCGMLLIIAGNVLFYLLIGNFVVKKLSDFFSFE
jgi:hypothetical protein